MKNLFLRNLKITFLATIYIIILELSGIQLLASEFPNVSNTDSLIKISTTANLYKKIAIYEELATNFYILGNSDSSYHFAMQAIRLAKDNSLIKQQIDAMNVLNQINSFYNSNEMQSLAEKTLKLSLDNNYEKGVAVSYFMLGNYYSLIDSSKALINLEKALDISQQKGFRFISALSKQKIGDFYLFSLKNYNYAIKYFFEARKIYDTLLLDSPTQIIAYNYGELLNSIGILFKMQDNYSEAAKYYEEYLQLSSKLGDHWGIGISLNNIGIIFDREGKTNQAIEYYQKAMDELKPLSGNESAIASIYHNLGNINSFLGNYKLANYYLDTAMALFHLLENKGGETRLLISKAENLIKLKKYKIAEQYLKQGLNQGIEVNDFEVIISAYYNLSAIEEKRGNLKKSLDYYKQYVKSKDSINNINNQEEIGMVKERYELERKIEQDKRAEMEAQTLEQERIQKRDSLQYMGIFIFLIVLFVVIIVSGRLKISIKRVESMIFIAFLLAFESILMLFDNEISILTNDIPLYSLLVSVAISISLTPLDTYLETKLRHLVVKKEMPE